MSGDEVCVEMGLKDMGNFKAHVLCSLNIDLDIPAGINDGAGFCPTEQIRAVRYALNKKLLNKHSVPPEFVINLLQAR
jgi:hypothetical protein